MIALTYSSIRSGTNLLLEGSQSEIDKAYAHFVAKYQKSYLTKSEYAARKAVF